MGLLLRLWLELRDLAGRGDVRVAQMVLVGMKCAWGIPLILHSSAFDTTAGYAAMRQVAPSWVWGAIFLGYGMLQLFAVLARFSWLQGVICLLSTALWGFAAVSLWQGSQTGTGAYFVGWLALTNAWIVVRISLGRARIENYKNGGSGGANHERA